MEAEGSNGQIRASHPLQPPRSLRTTRSMSALGRGPSKSGPGAKSSSTANRAASSTLRSRPSQPRLTKNPSHGSIRRLGNSVVRPSVTLKGHGPSTILTSTRRTTSENPSSSQQRTSKTTAMGPTNRIPLSPNERPLNSISNTQPSFPFDLTSPSKRTQVIETTTNLNSARKRLFSPEHSELRCHEMSKGMFSPKRHCPVESINRSISSRNDLTFAPEHYAHSVDEDQNVFLVNHRDVKTDQGKAESGENSDEDELDMLSPRKKAKLLSLPTFDMQECHDPDVMDVEEVIYTAKTLSSSPDMASLTLVNCETPARSQLPRSPPSPLQSPPFRSMGTMPIASSHLRISPIKFATMSTSIPLGRPDEEEARDMEDYASIATEKPSLLPRRSQHFGNDVASSMSNEDIVLATAGPLSTSDVSLKNKFAGGGLPKSLLHAASRRNGTGIPLPKGPPSQIPRSTLNVAELSKPTPANQGTMSADTQARLDKLQSILNKVPRPRSSLTPSTSAPLSKPSASRPASRLTRTESEYFIPLKDEPVSKPALMGRRRSSLQLGVAPTTSGPKRPLSALSKNTSGPRRSISEAQLTARTTSSILSRSTRGVNPNIEKCGSNVSEKKVATVRKVEGKRGTLNGVVAYVDVKTAEGDEAGNVFIDMLRALGAKVLLRPTVPLTHIIFKGGKSATMDKWCSHPDPKPWLVGIGWVVRCRELGLRASEMPYVVEVNKEAVQANRRRSMEPRAFALLQACHASKPNKSEPSQDQVVVVNKVARPRMSLAESIEQARRKSLQYAPKVGSPLAKRVVDASTFSD